MYYIQPYDSERKSKKEKETWNVATFFFKILVHNPKPTDVLVNSITFYFFNPRLNRRVGKVEKTRQIWIYILDIVDEYRYNLYVIFFQSFNF
jgi:hypothetical protein